MNFTFKQSTGQLFNPDGSLLGTGYAGNHQGLNNPAEQNVSMTGPLPQGRYTIGAPHDDAHVGAFAMALTPDPSNVMFGRSAFFIHGDNSAANHTASEGCIVIARPVREHIAASGVKALQVIA